MEPNACGIEHSSLYVLCIWLLPLPWSGRSKYVLKSFIRSMTAEAKLDECSYEFGTWWPALSQLCSILLVEWRDWVSILLKAIPRPCMSILFQISILVGFAVDNWAWCLAPWLLMWNLIKSKYCDVMKCELIRRHTFGCCRKESRLGGAWEHH